MWPNPQETAALVTFTEKILMENFIFCTVLDSTVTLKASIHRKDVFIVN